MASDSTALPPVPLSVNMRAALSGLALGRPLVTGVGISRGRPDPSSGEHRETGLDSCAVKSTPALIVIDMQAVAFDGKITPPITGGKELLASVSRLVRACRNRDIPIVYIQTCAASGQPYSRDVHGWEIHPEIAPERKDHVVFKRNSSGFDGTNLAVVLNDLGVRSVLVCGIWSEYCVRNTARDAASLGLEVFVITDAHGTVASDDASANGIVALQNRELAELGMKVLGIDELAVLLADAG